MNKFKLLCVLIACTILLSGCGAQNAASSAEPLPTDDGAKEITVEAMDIWGYYQNAALKFEAETRIKVNLINDYKMGPSDQGDNSANTERIQAELMAGKGADIYAFVYFDFTKIDKHLCNLANWIATDSDYSDDAYYMNILESGFDRGEVYSVPLFMNFWALGSDIEVPELNGQSLNWEEFFELTKDTKRSGVLYSITYNLFTRHFGDRQESFIDEGNKTQSLDSPEMIELLEQCKKWSAQGLCVPLSTENYSKIVQDAFFQEGSGNIELLINIQTSNPMGEGSYFYDIPSDSGKNDKAKIPAQRRHSNQRAQYAG